AHPRMPNQPNCGAALACGSLSQLSGPAIRSLFRSCFHHACSGRENQPQLCALTVVSMAGSTLTMIVVTSGCDGNHFSLGRQNAHEPWKIAQKAWFQSHASPCGLTHTAERKPLGLRRTRLCFGNRDA